MKYRYKNVSDDKLYLPGVGVVESGKEIELDFELNNANFLKVGEEKKKETKEEVKEELS